MDLPHLQSLLEKAESLDPELACYVEQSTLGLILQHPLVQSVPYFPQMAALHNAALVQKREKVIQAMRCCDWSTYIWLHERPWRLHALIEVWYKAANVAERGVLLRQVWLDQEVVWRNRVVYKLLFNQVQPKDLMNEEELIAWSSMPQNITVWRGTTRSRPYGISWTLDRDRALWFAGRLGAGGYLQRATVRKNDCRALFLGRYESEVIVLKIHNAIEAAVAGRHTPAVG